MLGYTLITGASSGIGRGIAERLSRNGPLLLSGRDAEALEVTRRACVDADSHRVWPYDLLEWAELEVALRETLAAADGFVEHFVHSAGIVEILPLRSMTPPKTLDLMSVNCLAAFELCRLLVKRKVNQRKPRTITFLSSTSSIVGEKGGNVYCASKGALDAFMRSLAVELAPDTRVNSILPGIVATQMAAEWIERPDYQRMLAERVPLGAGTVEDVVNAVDFLVSDGARWITGQQLVLDGGRSIT